MKNSSAAMGMAPRAVQQKDAPLLSTANAKMLKALESLQRHLALDARGARRWLNAVRKARR